LTKLGKNSNMDSATACGMTGVGDLRVENERRVLIEALSMRWQFPSGGGVAGEA